ncbi:hypothetical protein [Caulobacter sp. 602-1]|uniref:hypothetical protein n=1 Tax=unclassified Caulobacter TaxID=2648921 RepID=UPI000F630E95|nr:hypothetical protein [Caulobacter sp. 602-1]RRN62437.1 hypothetical protein EIK80_22300 [Caulobacter sp. 602-1]
MRASGFLLAGVCLTLLGACASPRAVGQGDVTGLKGLAPYSSSADGADAAFAKAVQARAIDALGGSGGGKPAYLVQVGVAVAPLSVGVSSAAGPLDDKAWRSPAEDRPWWRPWRGKGPARTVTLAVVEAGTGKTVAWSSIRVRKDEPAAVADLLVAALRPSTKG